ncbi:MAG: D-2-hydroxyacid dehydrogenase family protein [Solirubrobacteraceae bacterium]|nr:D-2-hydroxyacid dehydrogenase family protein [Patulibacter sp.]
MTRIVVLDDYQGVALTHADWDPVHADHEVVVIREHLDTSEGVLHALKDAEIVVAMRERTVFDAERIAQLPALRLLVTTGMANRSIDLDACRAAGITVCGTDGRRLATVELAWGLILAVLRSIPVADHGMREGRWQETVGFELDGATLGIVGLGRLGSAMVLIAKAFGMDVLAWSQHLDPAHAAELGARAVAKADLFAQADVVSVHYGMSERSIGLVGADEIGAMKPTAVLVNTSRGPIVDTPSLLDALHAGRIAGAGLDVYDQEPLPADHPLRGAPRTVLTPHLGYVTRQTYDVFYAGAVEDILAWRAGAPVRVLT